MGGERIGWVLMSDDASGIMIRLIGAAKNERVE